jgi:type I restriction enzyme S subunit
VKRGQYAYNPSRINVGSIARLEKWEVGVLSPMYVVFNLDKSRVDSDYFLHWLSSHEAKQRIKNSAQGSVRETISFSDLSSIPIVIPSLEQQRKIAEVLNTAKEKIILLEKLAEKYRTQKRGLIKKLLTSECRFKAEVVA